ncbi:MAG: helix-turn-helix domain-containing protein [Candidatus Aerophobetes bacterium]|nr:helix-turn-helix domain-containing protein [Candidatus Aerophobetes bacterium]
MKRVNQKNEFFYPEKIIHRANILDLVIKKKITQSQTAKELKLRSDRQIRKLLKKYHKGNYSLNSLIHTKSGEP